MILRNEVKRSLMGLVAAVLLTVAGGGGCASTENKRAASMQDALQFLERGQFNGEMVLTTDGSVAVYAMQSFGLGGGKSLLSATGKIDFSKAGAVRLQKQPVPPTVEGEKSTEAPSD